MKTAVIIPNYNGLRFMDSCMSALEKQTYRDFCVLIVDNGSTDGSAELLKRYESENRAEILLLSENTGFSGAVNAGIRYCCRKDEKPEYIVLLNNDTEAEPEYLAAMVRALEEDKAGRIAAVSPLMISLHDRTKIDSAGDGYSLVGWAFQRGTGRNVGSRKFAGRTEVFSACAGAAMYRRKALEEIRREDWIFDPAHFAYLEDVDVSMRLRIFGYSIVYEPASRVFHFGSGTSGSKYNSFKVRLAARNNVWLNVKNLPFLLLLADLPFLLAGVLVKQLFFTVRGFGKDYWNGFREGVAGIPGIRSHRTVWKPSRTWNYLKIEGRMITDLFSYLQDLFCRHFTDSL